MRAFIPTGLIVFCLAIALFIGCERAPVKPSASEAEIADPVTGVVTIEVVSPDGTKTITIDDVATGTTVEQVMRLAKDLPVKISGSGTTAFVDQIDGKSTSASEGWTYQIDGEKVHAGVGVTKLSPPTTVSWKFTGWDAK